jgi:hypothetical protein
MQSNSRRAFLTGRRVTQTPWEAFCQRMRRTVAGTFFEFETHDGTGSARLVPKQASDVHHARALCSEFGVVMALDGVPHAARLSDHPVLWVEPGRDMSSCQRLDSSSSQWFVQPGCLLGELESAGLTQFADLPCHITVAAWLADRSLCDWATGQTARSGVTLASVLMDDGNTVTLGPFGEKNNKPLNGMRLQRLVPELFQLAGGSDAQACREASRWPARYRADALLPQAGDSVNLAHLLLGHGGDLGWIEWVVIDQDTAQPQGEVPYAERYAEKRPVAAGLVPQATEVDARIKSLFDPAYLFPYPGQEL